MLKSKKIADNIYLHSDAETGEPVAISKRESYDKIYHTKWHPHIIQMHPEANEILNRPEFATDVSTSAYRANSALEKIQSGKKHEFDVQKDPESITAKTQYGDEVKHNLYHVIDRETGNKILTLRHNAQLASSKIGTGSREDFLTFHQQHIGTPENLEIAKKKVGKMGQYDQPNLRQWVDAASHLKKTVATGGPRFVGHTADLTGKSKKKTYKTSIQDPTAALNAYAEVAIPSRDKLTKTVITPSMHLYHGEDEHHIVKYNNGKVTHIDSKQTGYSETPNNQIFEGFERIS